MLLVAARERCNTSCLTCELSPCLECCARVSPSRRFANDHSCSSSNRANERNSLLPHARLYPVSVDKL